MPIIRANIMLAWGESKSNFVQHVQNYVGFLKLDMDKIGHYWTKLDIFLKIIVLLLSFVLHVTELRVKTAVIAPNHFS